MFEMAELLWLIPFLPFFGSAVIAVLGKTFLRGQSHWPCILAAIAACVLSVATLLDVRAEHHGPLILDQYVWFQAGDAQVGFDG